MKTTAISFPKDSKPDFKPGLYSLKNNIGTVIALITRKYFESNVMYQCELFEGVILHSTVGNWKVGEICKTFDHDYWEPFNGKVTIESE